MCTHRLTHAAMLRCAAVLLPLTMILTAGCGGTQPPPLAITANVLPEMSEGDTTAMTCEADASYPGGIASVEIRLLAGDGLLRADRDPAAETAAQDYQARQTGRSREAQFTCVAVGNDGNRDSIPVNTIVRDARSPEWDGAAPAVPANGSDGNPAGKVGVVFEVVVASKDVAAGAGNGVPSGIYQTTLTMPPNITVVNAVRTTAGRPKGPPDANVGPPDVSETFALTCTAVGAGIVKVQVTDTVENSIALDLGVECY